MGRFLVPHSVMGAPRGSLVLYQRTATDVRTVIVSRTDQPLTHPISQMTTYELRDLRQALEGTLAMETLPPYTRPREELQQQLTEVTAEQVERARIRRADTDA
jgi:hypothetical protein